MPQLSPMMAIVFFSVIFGGLLVLIISLKASMPMSKSSSQGSSYRKMMFF